MFGVRGAQGIEGANRGLGGQEALETLVGRFQRVLIPGETPFRASNFAADGLPDCAHELYPGEPHSRVSVALGPYCEVSEAIDQGRYCCCATALL